MLSDPIHWKFLEEVSQGLHGAKAALELHQVMVDRTEGKVPQATIHQGDEAKPLRILIERENAREES